MADSGLKIPRLANRLVLLLQLIFLMGFSQAYSAVFLLQPAVEMTETGRFEYYEWIETDPYTGYTQRHLRPLAKSIRQRIMQKFVDDVQVYKDRPQKGRLRPWYRNPDKILERDALIPFDRAGFVVHISDITGEILGAIRILSKSFTPFLKGSQDSFRHPVESLVDIELPSTIELALTTTPNPTRMSSAWIMWQVLKDLFYTPWSLYERYNGKNPSMVFFGDRVSATRVLQKK